MIQTRVRPGPGRVDDELGYDVRGFLAGLGPGEVDRTAALVSAFLTRRTQAGYAAADLNACARGWVFQSGAPGRIGHAFFGGPLEGPAVGLFHTLIGGLTSAFEGSSAIFHATGRTGATTRWEYAGGQLMVLPGN